MSESTGAPGGDDAGPSQPPAPFPRLNRILDAAGLALLVWAATLALIGTCRPDGLAQLSMVSGAPAVTTGGPGVHTLLVAALAALALPLAVQIAVSFGRPGAVPGRRLTMALPLIAGLAAVTVCRFVAGFLVPAAHGGWFAVAAPAGWFDGQAALVAAAATAALVLRPSRITPRVRSIAEASLIVTATSTVLHAVLVIETGYRSGMFTGRLGLALGLQEVIAGAVSSVLAVVLIRGLRRSAAWAAPGVCVWGLADALSQVLPQDLGSFVSGRSSLGPGGLIDGLDWAIGAVTVGAAVLLAPVVLMFRRSPVRRRAIMLSGAVIVLGVLGAALLGGRLVMVLILYVQERVSPMGNGPSAGNIVVLGAGVLGAGLLVAAGAGLRQRPSQQVLKAGAGLVVLGGVLLLVDPGTVPGYTFTFLAGLTGTAGFRLLAWDGYLAALTVVLPILVVVLCDRLRRRQAAQEG